MQHDQSAAPQDFSRAPDQPTWDQRISVDGLAVAIDIEDRNRDLSLLWPWLPQRSGPACQSFCKESIRSNGGQLCQKPLDVAIAVGAATTCEECQSLTSVATQIPRPP